MSKTGLAALLLTGCTGIIEGGPAPVGELEPEPARASDSTNAVAAPPKTEAGGCTVSRLARPRAWRLTHAQLRNTLAASVGFSSVILDGLPAETRVDGYANQSDRLTIAPLLADAYLRASEELAAHVLARAAEWIKCPLASLATGSCLSDFVRSFGLRMWRRPLTETEVTRLSSLFRTVSGPELGVKTVVQAIFMSPNFLYRVEVGNSQQPGAVSSLTDHELASALSYLLWDSAPDATLMDLAGQGKLRDPRVLAEQARRMLATREASRAMHAFLRQWLRIDTLASKVKDPAVFPLFSPQVAADLIEETRLLLEDAGSVRALLTASHGFLNARTAPIYGLSKTSTTLAKTPLDPNQRRGLLTSGAFLAAHANATGTALVDRGKYLREELLCAPVPPPNPAAAMFDPKVASANATGRERFALHSIDPACAVCHRLFDGLGFALETYDGIGRYRTTDKGKPIDPSGVVPLPSGPELSFSSFVDLVDQLAGTPDPYRCFSAQYLAYGMGRRIDEIDACERTRIADELMRSGQKIDALVLALVGSSSFTSRRN